MLKLINNRCKFDTLLSKNEQLDHSLAHNLVHYNEKIIYIYFLLEYQKLTRTSIT